MDSGKKAKQLINDRNVTQNNLHSTEQRFTTDYGNKMALLKTVFSRGKLGTQQEHNTIFLHMQERIILPSEKNRVQFENACTCFSFWLFTSVCLQQQSLASFKNFTGGKSAGLSQYVALRDRG